MNELHKEIHNGWQVAKSAPGAISDPSSSALDSLNWIENAPVPGTVAQALGVDFSKPETYQNCKLDSYDWWYRCTFDQESEAAVKSVLHFEGLATLAEVWLNGAKMLSSKNMFVPYSVDVSERLKRNNNQLVICFKSLDAELASKKPRPKWKTALVHHQNLRFIRTTLLGRMPGWSPPVAPVGPWKSVKLETLPFEVKSVCRLKPSVQFSGKEVVPQLEVEVGYEQRGVQALERVSVSLLGKSYDLLKNGSSSFVLNLEIPEAPLWWPHTHGKPSLIECVVTGYVAQKSFEIKRAHIGFKSVKQVGSKQEKESSAVQFEINGTPVFCRGACWTVNEFLSLVGSEVTLRETLTLAQKSGLNMLRVGGTMLYESDAFYQLCDELGILVWQDFMFANMDYPVLDPEFLSEIKNEATTQLKRLSQHACIAVYCGGSEIQQQAAMMGLPSQNWSNDFFDNQLPALCEGLHPQIPYFASSPVLGKLPFHVSTGIAHYYGVGAYKRPLTDVKHAAVKFATECLAFANLPCPETLAQLITQVPHHPLWKERVPRDHGSSWDFEDTRDHYLKTIFGVDPQSLRATDLPQYFRLSNAAVGQALKTVYAEWRKPKSNCGGGLIWFLKDLWPGAGWGIIDSFGKPKSALHYLKTAWAPQTVLITDEGLDGLQIHAINEAQEPLEATLHLACFQAGKVVTAKTSQQLLIPAQGAVTLIADELLGYFSDLTNSYRFGPAKHNVVRASLVFNSNIVEDYYFVPETQMSPVTLSEVEGKLTPKLDPVEGEGFELRLKSLGFLRDLQFVAPGFLCSKNNSHLAPGQEGVYFFKPQGVVPKTIKVEISALNLGSSSQDSLILRGGGG